MYWLCHPPFHNLFSKLRILDVPSVTSHQNLTWVTPLAPIGMVGNRLTHFRYRASNWPCLWVEVVVAQPAQSGIFWIQTVVLSRIGACSEVLGVRFNISYWRQRCWSWDPVYVLLDLGSLPISQHVPLVEPEDLCYLCHFLVLGLGFFWTCFRLTCIFYRFDFAEICEFRNHHPRPWRWKCSYWRCPVWALLLGAESSLRVRGTHHLRFRSNSIWANGLVTHLRILGVPVNNSWNFYSKNECFGQSKSTLEGGVRPKPFNPVARMNLYVSAWFNLGA